MLGGHFREASVRWSMGRRQRPHQGAFITTSDFSDGARSAALGLDIKVVLIDGVELARLMVENNLGVSVKQVY